MKRFLSIDPLAAKYPSNSPYGFVGNSPLINVEQLGAYYITYNKSWDRYVLHVTNTLWIEKMSTLSAIPVLGWVAEASLAGARGADPSFNTSASDIVGLGLQVAGAGSLKLLGKLGRIDGLGKFLLNANRELTASLFTALSSPETAEVATDYFAMKRLEGLGIGEEWETLEGDQGKTMTRSFGFKKDYVEKVRQEILGNAELTSQKGFDLDQEVQRRLGQVMEESKAAVRTELEKED
jgi:hypothetical protein